MTTYAPGKGFFGALTKKTLDFFQEALEDVWNAYGEDGDELQDEKRGEEILKRLRGSAIRWHEEKDRFGKKLYKSIEWGSQLYRVTVVLKDNGAMHIDIRQWFDPNA